MFVNSLLPHTPFRWVACIAVGLLWGMGGRVEAVELSGESSRLVANQAVLEAIKSMPVGGRYAANAAASAALCKAIGKTPMGLEIDAGVAKPSYCSGATYLVFVTALDQLSKSRGKPISSGTAGALLVRGQKDGAGVWGRWNANGPGTARLFSELKLGSNFTDFEKAQPGDFLKIFWTEEIGRSERGHSVVYLGRRTEGGIEEVHFWSSNQPAGFGDKWVRKTAIARALFSRLENPERIEQVENLPAVDGYLAGLLSKASTWEDVRSRCGF